MRLPSRTLQARSTRTRSTSVNPPLYIWLGVIQSDSPSAARALTFPPVAVSSPIVNSSLVLWMICSRASASVSIALWDRQLTIARARGSGQDCDGASLRRRVRAPAPVADRKPHALSQGARALLDLGGTDGDSRAGRRPRMSAREEEDGRWRPTDAVGGVGSGRV